MVVIHVSIYAGYLPVHEAYISLRPFYHKIGRRSVIYYRQDTMFYLKLVTVSTLFCLGFLSAVRKKRIMNTHFFLAPFLPCTNLMNEHTLVVPIRCLLETKASPQGITFNIRLETNVTLMRGSGE